MNWNKITKRAGALALCATLAVGSFALPAGAAGVTAQLSPNISIVVDGAARTFYNATGSEVHPIVYNGTTYLPIRAIGELMGKNVNWDQSSLTVSISGTRTAGAVSGTPDTAAVTQNVTGDIRSDVTIMVDGIRQNFTDVNGNAVYPMIYNYARLDWDDGRAEYEVKIYYGTMEYEFEIDAYSGAIISRDVESIYD